MFDSLNWPQTRSGQNVSQREYDTMLEALERLYAAFPDCEGGEQGKSCLLARLVIAAANEGVPKTNADNAEQSLPIEKEA